MKRRALFLLAAAALALAPATARADDDNAGRPGTITWSDGRSAQGAFQMTGGKQLRLFATNGQPYLLQLDEIRDLHFTAESEEMWKGYYFPNSGQAVKVYTGDVYPIRQIQAHVTLNDGRTIDGHLFATVIYLTNDDGTQKIPIVAKQTGPDGQKLSDLIYPTDIKFDSGLPTTVSQVDLTAANLKNPVPKSFVVFARPDMAPVPAVQPDDSKPVWTVALANPKVLFFAVRADDGLHVAWPAQTEPPGSDIYKAAQAEVDAMNDFYDTRKLLSCFAEGDDVYSLLLMKRMGWTDAMNGNDYPWSVVITHSKYDPDQKKIVALMHRASLLVTQSPRKKEPAPVIQEPGFIPDATVVTAPPVSAAPATSSTDSASTTNPAAASPPAASPSNPQGTNP